MLRLPGVIVVVLGTKGKVDGGSVTDVLGLGDGLGLAWPITVVLVASAGESPVPWTTTVSVIEEPTVAVVLMWSVTISSNAWFAGSEPIEQLLPKITGHSVKRGVRVSREVDATVAVTF